MTNPRLSESLARFSVSLLSSSSLPCSSLIPSRSARRRFCYVWNSVRTRYRALFVRCLGSEYHSRSCTRLLRALTVIPVALRAIYSVLVPAQDVTCDSFHGKVRHVGRGRQWTQLGAITVGTRPQDARLGRRWCACVACCIVVRINLVLHFICVPQVWILVELLGSSPSISCLKK